MQFERLRPLIKKYDDEGKEIKQRIDPEDKQYLVLMFLKENEETKTFEIITGRKSVYDYIRENIDNIDILKSLILVNAEGVTLNDAITVYAFMKHMEQFFQDENFSIEDYRDEDETETFNDTEESTGDPMMDQVRDVQVGTSDREDV
jgi:DNA-binding protein